MPLDLKQLEQKISNFWSKQINYEHFNWYIRLFAVFACIHLLSSFPKPIEWYFSINGHFPPKPLSFFRFSFFSLLSPLPLALFHSLVLWALILMIFGFSNRFLLVLTWIWHLSVWRDTLTIHWHMDALLMIHNFYLIFFPNKKQTLHYGIFPLQLLKIQLTLTYLGSALYKFSTPEWIDGRAIHNAMLSWLFTTPFTVSPLPAQFIGIGIILLEFLLPVALWFRRCQIPCFYIATLFHLSIFFLTPIKLFSVYMISLQLFYLPNWVEQLDIYTQRIKGNCINSLYRSWNSKKRVKHP